MILKVSIIEDIKVINSIVNVLVHGLLKPALYLFFVKKVLLEYSHINSFLVYL